MMEARLAVLEKIAATTETLLAELRAEVKGLREKQDADFRALAADNRALSEKISSEVLKLYLAGAATAAAIAALIAHGFKWF